VIELKNVSKAFGPLSVLRKLSLSVQSGEVVLLVGANGAGKSTLLKTIAGLSKVDSGSITRGTKKIGFVSHHLFLYGRLTVQENLTLFSSVSGREFDSSLLSAFNLEGVARQAVATLSKGNQARVGIARAFIDKPELILLDEPTSNLDEKATALLLAAIARRMTESQGGVAVVFATHDIHRVAHLATRIVVLDRGAVVDDTGPFASREKIDKVLGSYRAVNR
jgi:ABC-type multidrug transport system ATPase subunit